MTADPWTHAELGDVAVRVIHDAYCPRRDVHGGECQAVAPDGRTSTEIGDAVVAALLDTGRLIIAPRIPTVSKQPTTQGETS